MLNLFDNYGGSGRGGYYYNNYDDIFYPFGYRYGHPPSSYQRQRDLEIQRQRAIEAERRRRAAAEAAAAAEEERRRRIMYQQALMEERQRRAAAEEYERRQRQLRLAEEEEEERRQIAAARRAEAERQRRIRAVQQQQQQQRQRQQTKTAIVRGPDGRLYRVYLGDDDEVLGYTPKKQNKSKRASNGVTIPILRKQPSGGGGMDTESEESLASSTKTSDGIYRSAAEAEEDENAVRMSNVSATVSPIITPAAIEKTIPIKVRSTSAGKKKKRMSAKKGKKKQKIVITVEDASDSEYEDDFASPWRNRRPGPGESWIEPVQSAF